MPNIKITDTKGNIFYFNDNSIDYKILDFGGGNFDLEYGDSDSLGYGSFTFISDEDFFAWVELWGADGGSFGSNIINDFQGIGGFTKALIKFKKDTNYTITAGQAGYFKNSYTHGGGAPGYVLGGQGGGMSGLFINSEYYGKEEWNNDFNIINRSQVLLIAGGGGGKGGTDDKKISDPGNGGGWTSQASFNSSPSFQEINESSMIGLSPVKTDNNGGGGGGWVGGGSNQSLKVSNCGASGGSGHIVHKEEYAQQPNNDHWDSVVTGITKFGDPTRQDIYKKALDKTKFTVIKGMRDSINNKYKNIFVPQHGRFVMTLSDGSYIKEQYLPEIKPYATIN
jgi:hypothetical protein